MLSVEISTIYKRDDRTRKVHHLVYLPDFAAVERFNAALGRIGNLGSDGRPILGLDSRDLLEITLECGGYLVPAHIWTPWFSALGSKSGFDAIADCYADLAEHIFAVETGLSSDPEMNWRVSSLDRYRLVSNSDAHSAPALAREATLLTAELDFSGVRETLRTGQGLAGTLEFFPEEGKYHADGHRACGVNWPPARTREAAGRCPECGKPLTVGVLHRIEELADRPAGYSPANAPAVTHLIQLHEILGEINGVGAKSKSVEGQLNTLVAGLGSELSILRTVPVDEIARVGGTLLGEAIGRLRRGEARARAGRGRLRRSAHRAARLARPPHRRARSRARCPAGGQRSRPDRDARPVDPRRPRPPELVVAGPRRDLVRRPRGRRGRLRRPARRCSMRPGRPAPRSPRTRPSPCPTARSPTRWWPRSATSSAGWSRPAPSRPADEAGGGRERRRPRRPRPPVRS